MRWAVEDPAREFRARRAIATHRADQASTRELFAAASRARTPLPADRAKTPSNPTVPPSSPPANHAPKTDNTQRKR